MPSFSPQAIAALVQVVTGGQGGTPSGPKIGKYRSGPTLELLFGNCNLDLQIGSQSRVPAVRSLLTEVNRAPDGVARLAPVFEASVDPRDFEEAQEDHAKALDYLNRALLPDGCELKLIGGRYRLVSVASQAAVASALYEQADALVLNTVLRDFERALNAVQNDPEGAITSACSTLESVCKTVLGRMGFPLPAKQDIASLTKEVRRRLDLAPRGERLTPELEADLNTIVSGLSNTANGIGSLRTHVGDAHGRDDSVPKMDARTARLAINAASTVALYIIETWQASSDKPTG